MKSQPISQSRNNSVDIIRGLAMLMVVLQHTIVGTTVGFEDSLLFGMIWSLQMPLFFIISGYVTRYSRTINTGSNLWNFLKKRSLAYLLPWLVWTVVIRGIILGQDLFLNFRYLLWHMDSGYWFLVSLWCIVILYGLTDFIVNRFHVKSAAWSIVLHVCGMALGMGVLGGIGLMVGMDFLDIKLTIYYIPLFTGGYLYGQLQERISTIKYSKTIMPVVYALCLGIWLWILVNIHFYAVEMTPITIAMRYIASIVGAIFVISCFTGEYKWGGTINCRCLLSGDLLDTLFVSKSPCRHSNTSIYNSTWVYYDNAQLYDNSYLYNSCDTHIAAQPSAVKNSFLQKVSISIIKALSWCGVNSLAIYLVHGFYLNSIARVDYKGAYEIFEIPICALNYVICVTCTAVTIILLNRNNILSKILFWK